jgi:hypothetical protein
MLGLKYNESFGFVGIDGGNSPADVDKSLTDAQMSIALGGDGLGQLLAFPRLQLEIPDEAIEFMRARGWEEDEALYRCNGDVAAYGFRG